MSRIPQGSGYPIVEVEWIDASYDDTVRKPEDFEPLVRLHMVGYLIRDDKESISLAMQHEPEEGTFRHVVHVPKVCIKRQKRLKS